MSDVETTTLGPAACNFSGHHNLVVGDTYYIGSRDLDPARLVAFHLPSRRVTAQRDFPGYRHVSALVEHGDTLYAAVQRDRKHSTLFGWHLPTGRTEPVAEIGGITVWALKVGDDRRMYLVGQEDTLSLNAIDLDTGTVTVVATPDADAAQPPTTVITEDRIFFGTGGVVGDERSGTTRTAELFEIDRATGATRSILPPELAGDLSLVGLAVVGDRMFVGTKAVDGPAAFAVLSMDDYSVRSIDRPAGPTGFWAIIEVGEDLCCFSGSAIYRYRAATGEIAKVADLGGALAGGLQHHDGTMLAMAWPMPWPAGPPGTTLHLYDLATGQLERVEIPELGRPVDAQPVQSLTAAGDRVYAAAAHLDVHDVRAGTVTKSLELPRSVKAMAVAEGGAAAGTLFAGLYDAGELWAYDPVGGHCHRVGAFPPDCARAWDMAWDAGTDLVLTVSAPDGPRGGGALTVYAPATGKLDGHLDPVGPAAVPVVLAAGAGLVFVAGARGPDDGPLACWDPVDGRRVWLADPGLGGQGALAHRDGLLYGITGRGLLYAFDVDRREVVGRRALDRRLWSGRGRLAWSAGCLYAGSGRAVLQVDPSDLEVTVLADELDGKWVGGRPGLGVDGDGNLYTLRGTALLRISGGR